MVSELADLKVWKEHRQAFNALKVAWNPITDEYEVE
jgi:hypothetical protein